MNAEAVLKEFSNEIKFPKGDTSGLMFNAGCDALAAGAVLALAEKGMAVVPSETFDALVAALDEARDVAGAIAGENQPAREWAVRVRNKIDAALALARKVSP